MFDPWVGKIPWRRAWQPTPVFLPEEFHGQTSLAGCRPWDGKQSDMTEWLSTQAPKLLVTLHISIKKVNNKIYVTRFNEVLMFFHVTSSGSFFFLRYS